MNNLSQRKFSEEQILLIRGSMAEQQPKFSMNQLARIYGVAVNTIWRIQHGFTYKELGAAGQLDSNRSQSQVQGAAAPSSSAEKE